MATPASTAARVSANCGLSATSRPSTNPMPLVLARIQPPSAAPFTATPDRLTGTPERTSASAPQPICSAAVTAKATTTPRCSLWAPAAVAWMAPAARDASAAKRSVPGAVGRESPAGAGSTASTASGSVVVTWSPPEESPPWNVPST